MMRIVIIGLDGVPYRLLDDLARRDIMPNTKSIIEKGTFRQMESSIPEVSSVAWSSIITGKNPGEHGIFGFTDIPHGTYRLSFPNFNDLKAMPFWQKQNSGRSIIINVPSTFPVKPLNGVHISGFVSLDLERSVYPKTLIPKLKKMDYRLDVDSDKAHKSLDLFLEDLNKTLNARVEAYRYLWKNCDWHLFMLVFTGTDRLMHFLWDAYENERHVFHSSFLDYFHRIDEVIGEINSGLNNNDILILLSDHGFEHLEQDININYVLQRGGFLKFVSNSEREYNNIDYSTKAFALDPARIYINLEGKYPKGKVKAQDVECALEELKNLFYSLKIDSKSVIARIYRKEEIYKGPFINLAPDLVLLPNEGFNLKSTLTSEKLCDKGIFTGKHTHGDAFLILKNKDILNEISIPENLCVSDLVGIIDKIEFKTNRYKWEKENLELINE